MKSAVLFSLVDMMEETHARTSGTCESSSSSSSSHTISEEVEDTTVHLKAAMEALKSDQEDGGDTGQETPEEEVTKVNTTA